MRTIKLTEQDLEKIVKKVLSEQGSMFGVAGTGIPGYRKDDTRNLPKTNKIEDINPKKLKLGDGGKTSPKLIPDVKILQKKLMDLGLLKTDTNIPTGYFGPKTDEALKKYNNSTTKKTTNVPEKGDGGFILIWAFPEYEPKVDGKGVISQFIGSSVRILSGGGTEGTYGKLGHGGCVIVKLNGDAVCYEFGRYPGAKSQGYGKVRTLPLGKIAKIVDGKLVNAQEVAQAARRKTFPPGPSMKMTVAVMKLPNVDAATQYASIKDREYTALDFKIGDDANCGTFARDVASAGGVKVAKFCFPTPVSVVNSFKDQSNDFFEI
jgi:peptidoglycan hydrolase-like protein with peptidoglycan-binding domain